MSKKKILITGGVGFIGTNAAINFIKKGWNVSIVDNLSKIGTDNNLRHLKQNYLFKFHKIDIRNTNKIDQLFKRNSYDMVLHLAGQVAVTKSIKVPKDDFEINALGTINILEALRKHNNKAFFLNASTNKVYGKMDNAKLSVKKKKYQYKDFSKGIDESFPVDFHSPYGCSKGSAEQYVVDYARVYGLKTTSFRQSCIYGVHQYGIEDHGWISWFIIALILKKPFKIFGNGKQVRDILYIDDLIKAYFLAYKNRQKISGEVFNIGGGPSNAISILELFDRLSLYKKDFDKKKLNFSKWRVGDQKIFISNNNKAKKILNWEPEHSISQGIDKIFNWINKNVNLIK